MAEMPPGGEASPEQWQHPAIVLELDSRPEAVTLVRAALGALAERVEIDAELLDDLRTAISEACNNVVLHAYADRPRGGPLRMELTFGAEQLVAVVRDRGVGLDQAVLASESGASGGGSDIAGGVGIPVIIALTTTARFLSPPHGGTEVEMSFAIRRDGRRLVGAVSPAAPVGPDGAGRLVADVTGSVSPGMLLAPVLGRLARTLAAAARFSLDRFSDVYLITDAIGAILTHDAAGHRVVFGLRGAERRLELSVGPLREGCAERIRALEADGVGPSPLVALSDELAARPAGPMTEWLQVVLVDRPE